MDKIPKNLLLPNEFEGGCSAKIPAKELEQILRKINWGFSENVIVGLESGDDAGIYQISEEQAIILTTDFFPPVTQDPFLYGEIAATNALSDIYAMGGVPLAALNITLFPSEKHPLTLLERILEGGASTAKRAGIPIIGGHTIANPQPTYGMAVIGIVHPQHVITNTALTPGLDLILTKPLGTGTAIAAERIHLETHDAFQQAVRSMRQLNNKAAQLMQRFGIKAATDITGFGLAGHAKKMAQGSNVTIEIEVQKVPHFDGVKELLQQGCIPGASFRNTEHLENQWEFQGSVPQWQKHLLTDPQTSGGLLMGIAPDMTEMLLTQLRESGYPHATHIGHTTEMGKWAIRVLG